MSSSRIRNRQLNIREYYNGQTVLESLPRFLVIELTQGCNLVCPMCRPQRLATKSYLMDDKLFDRIADQLLPTAEMVDLRGWGESLILPNIEARIERVASFGPEIRFVSNFSFRRDRLVDRLAEFGCHVMVSLDSCEPDVLSRVRPGTDLGLVQANIIRLVRRISQMSGARPPVVLHAVFQEATLLSAWSLAGFCKRVGVETLRVSLATGALAMSAATLAVAAESLLRLKEECAQLGVALQVLTAIRPATLDSQRQRPCIHPWSYAYIRYDGAVSFCDHLIGPTADEYTVGNFLRTDFMEVWNSPEMRSLRAEHLGARSCNASKFDECAWCYRNRFVEFEDRFIPEEADGKVFLS